MFRDLNTYLRERFGQRVQKVPIDAGFDCPNRDGTCGTGGCVFCSPRGSAAGFVDPVQSVSEQLAQGIESARERYRASKFIAYFQAFTNTYLPDVQVVAGHAGLVSRLRAIYQPVLEHTDVVGLAIGTRPDCLPDEVIQLLLEIAREKLVFLELGLQSAHDVTLQTISRGHDVESFIDAVQRVEDLRKLMAQPEQTSGLDIVVHIILGLPGETKEMMLETARLVTGLPVQGVKIHMLHVVRGTPLETMFEQGQVTLMSLEEYVPLVGDVIEILPPHMVIHRITGEASRQDLVAPDWVLGKSEVRSRILAEMKRRQDGS